MSDTKLDPRSLTAEERVLFHQVAIGVWLGQPGAVNGEHIDFSFDAALRYIGFSRALFAPPESEMEKAEWTGNVKCPDCGRQVNEAHCGGPNHVYQRAQPEPKVECPNCGEDTRGHTHIERPGSIHYVCRRRKPAPPEPAATEYRFCRNGCGAQVAFINGVTGPCPACDKPAAPEREMPHELRNAAAGLRQQAESYSDGSVDGMRLRIAADRLESWWRNLAQPVAVGMTEELSELLSFNDDTLFPDNPERGKRWKSLVAAVRRQATAPRENP